MRIIHVSDCYAPRTGGIETQVRDLARAQAAAGHEVHVLTATPGAAGERGGAIELDDGVVVHRLGAQVPFDLPVNPAAPPKVRALLAELPPGVVHVHAGVLSPFAFDGARVAVEAGAPVAITWHCMLDGAVPVLRAAVRASRWADAPVALSAVSGAAAARVAQVFDAQVGVVPNGMDQKVWAPAARRSAPGRPVRVVATMRLAPRKRGPALVDVMADVASQLEPGDLTLDVIGDGPARGSMEKRAERRGLTGVVRFRGRLERSAVRDAYADADVFVAPAVLEAFGIAALEARTAGLVVVAHRGTGIEEFVTHDVDGLLVDDDAGMARALVRLVHEPGLLARLRTAASAEPPVFDWAHALGAAQTEYARARSLAAGG
ncbi:MAG: glycosyltransferase family 4 protein [Cellulomonadaceae bacterium]|nr:glycosyltransferase family 4 protein [Cellulomonadaceae bacterium]